jgi:hypothetical protein
MRNLIRYIVAAVSVAIVAGHPGILQSVARGQTATAQPVVQDNFDDNKTGTLWKPYTDNPNTQVKEINKRVEFTAKASETPMFAGYVASSTWPIDPNHDFALRLDLNYDLVTMEGGWLTFGVTPNNTEPRKQYTAFGLACVSLFPSFWREWKEGYEVRWTFEQRTSDKTTLYITYDAASDTVYMGRTGYGPENAWEVLPDNIRGRWGSKPVYVFMGLATEGAVVDAGHAFVDNFSLDQGVLVNTEPPKPPGPEPNTPPGTDDRVDVAADVSVQPSVVKRYVGVDPITVVLTLPKGFFPSHVDTARPVVLAPVGVQATTCTTFLWLSGRVVTVASFDRAKVMQAIPANGETSLTAIGYLKDGRHFGGAITIKIE